MNEINIADVLARQRRQKGVTQQALAGHVGVTKASVSKWETGQSYPDVTLLPILAAYFDITIDELIDYKPQMDRADIKKLYRRLCADFTKKPFSAVMEDCRDYIKKYYACFPLLLQMGILLINHAELAQGPQLADLIREAKALFIRVKAHSGEMPLIKKALYMEALCCLMEGDPEGSLALLEGAIEDELPPEAIMASAYQSLGRTGEASTTLQAGIYQNIVVLFNYFPAYLMLCLDSPEKFEETLRRAILVAEAFNMERLHPVVLIGLYIAAAQGYAIKGNADKALDMLRRYERIVTGDIYPLRLHGDGYFDLLDEWIEALDLGSSLPRDERTIKKSMADSIIHNPAFSALQGDPRFQAIAAGLAANAGGST